VGGLEAAEVAAVVSAGPPRLPRAVLRRALPEVVRRQLIGDLDQEFTERLAAHRPGYFWYWRQALASLPYAWQLRRRHAHRGQAPLGRVLAFRLADAARDLRHGLRLLGRQPVLALSVTVTMALGIGASTSVLTLAHAVLLRGLPYDDASRLVSVAEIDTRRETSSGNVSWPDFLDYQSRAQTLTLAGWSGGSRTLLGVGLPDRVVMSEVTAGFFAVLGVRPAMGRDFVDADFLDGAPISMLLTDRAWRRRFGGDPDVIGRRVDVGGQPTTIIGVLPAGFEFPLRGLSEIWLPIRPSQAQRERRYYHWLDVIGRLKPGVAPEQAEGELKTVAAGFAEIDAKYHAAATVRLTSLTDRIVGEVRPVALVLTVASVLLLAGACASVAGVLLARGLGRAHELGVRVAIGAGQGRIVRQLLVEGFALALPGAIAGLVAGMLAVRAFAAMMPMAQRASLPHLDGMALDPVMLTLGIGLALTSALACGVAPAWQALRRGVGALALRAGTVRAGETRAQAAMVAAQIALALILVTGAALLGRSLTRLIAVSPGFDPAGLLTFRVNLAPPRDSSPDAVRAFQADVLRGVRGLAAARGAATINQPPLSGTGNSGIFTVQGAPEVEQQTLVRTVSTGYFELLRLERLKGRLFDGTDRQNTPRVVVVNQLLANSVFGGDAVGRRISFPFFEGRPWWEIVGVVSNEQFDMLDRGLRPVVYFAHEQDPGGGFTVLVRTDADPAAIEPAIRRAVFDVDQATPVYGLQPLTSFIDQSDGVFRRKTAVTVIAGFAVSALALAVVGLYGAVALMVSRRTREIGIRQALGATPAGVVRAMLRRGLAPVAIGLAAGLVASLGLMPLLGSLMFGLQPSDPLTIAAAVVILLLVTVLAAFVPARRAARIDPVAALRLD
jgi:putative ABC transport system permease protein